MWAFGIRHQEVEAGGLGVQGFPLFSPSHCAGRMEGMLVSQCLRERLSQREWSQLADRQLGANRRAQGESARLFGAT